MSITCFKKRTYRKGIYSFALLALLAGSASHANAAKDYSDPVICAFMANDQSGIKAVIDKDQFSDFLAAMLPGHALRITGTIYDAAGALVTADPLIGTNFNNTVIFKAGTLPPSSQIVLDMQEINEEGSIFTSLTVSGHSAGSTVPGGTVINDPCDELQPPPQTMTFDACLRPYDRGGAYLKLTFDPAFQLYASYYGYTPFIDVHQVSNPSLGYTHLSPGYTAKGIMYFMDNLDYNECYTIKLYLEDHSHNQVVSYTVNNACACNTPSNCNSDFTAFQTNLGNGQFTATLIANHIMSNNDNWTIKKGATVLYNGPNLSNIPGLFPYTLTYGGYTVCHKARMLDGSECETCKLVNYTGPLTGTSDGGYPTSKPATQGTTNRIMAYGMSGQIRINYFADQQGSVSYAIYNNMGQCIITQQRISIAAGENSFIAPDVVVAPGIYYIHVSGENTNLTSAFAIQ